MEQSSRANERDRAVFRTFLGGAGLQMAVALSTLASFPFITRYLSGAEFGVFATLTGFAALLSFADFGIGGSLTTRLAHAQGRDDPAAANRTVSTSVVASCMAGLVVAGVLASSLWFVPWQRLLGAEDVSGVRMAVGAAAIASGAAVPAGIGQRLLYGVGKGAVANVWLVVASTIGAALLVAGSLSRWPLYTLVLIALCVPVLAGCASGVSAVARYAPHLRPRFASASAEEWRFLRKATSWHFAIGLAGAISFQTDALVVASVLGATSAGVYAVAVRAFGLIAQSFTPAMMQLWPAFGEAHVRGDLAWIRSRLLATTLIAGVTSFLAGLAMVAFGPEIIRVVLTNDLVPDRSLLVALTVWTTYSLVSAPTFLLLNAVGGVRVHAIAAVAVAVVNLPTSLLMTHWIGISGPAWGSLIASVVCSGPLGVVTMRRVLSGSALSQRRPSAR